MERLFVYGSLKPGGPNEHVLAAVEGDWELAVMRGRLVESGWGARLDYPGLVLDGTADDIAGKVLESTHLASLWATLDRLEGDDYERKQAPATLASGRRVETYVYVIRSRT